jgi:hypothetical protein
LVPTNAIPSQASVLQLLMSSMLPLHCKTGGFSSAKAADCAVQPFWSVTETW